MVVACCTDDNFVMPCGIMLKSLCLNNYDTDILVYLIIDASVSEKSKLLLQSCVGNSEKHVIEFCLIDEASVSRYPSLGKFNPHVSKATYYRLFMSEFLPKNISKVLYLDCDMIICQSLAELWNINIQDYAIAGVIDQCDQSIDNYNRLHYPHSYHYINAGMLLINLDYWRRHDVMNVLLSYIKKYPDRIKFHDQDVLNAVFYDKKKLLPLKFNVQTSFYHKIEFMNIDYWENSEELKKAIQYPVILHFSSGLKPWFKDCLHPMRHYFYNYKSKSPWKNQKLLKRKILFKTKIKIFLEKIGFLSKEPLLYNI